MKSIRGHWIVSTTRKKPELLLHKVVDNKETLYVKAFSEAIYLVVQLPKGGKTNVKCYQALTNDGETDDTEPTTTISLESQQNVRIQKSDIVITLAPYVKIEIETSNPTEVKIYYDYM